MRFVKILALSVLALSSMSAMADIPRQYFGLVISDAQFRPDRGTEEDTANFDVKLGYNINKYLGAELHLGTSLSSSNDTLNKMNVGYAAPLMRATLPFNRVNVYGLLGVASVRGEFDGNYDDHYSDIAFGAGIELFGTTRTALSFEYMQYGADDIYKTLGVGIVHYFEWPRLYNPRVNDK